jgi:hypothetical protein
VRRSRLPLDQKAAQMQSRAALEEKQRDRAAAAGKAAGMPRFLNPAGTTEAAASEADAVSANASAGDVPALLQEDETAIEEPIQRMENGVDLVDDLSPEPLPEISGEGVETEVSAYSVSLRGRTDASFSSSFRTRRVRTTAATGCEGCDGECVHVTGTLVSTFRVRTTVTLPSVNDFPDLSACQRQRVRDGINNVLRPHEHEHVTAFRTYNGTVSTPFDFTLCRGELDPQVQALHDSIEAPRQAAAQAESDALDPFEFEVDLDCED